MINNILCIQYTHGLFWFWTVKRKKNIDLEGYSSLEGIAVRQALLCQFNENFEKLVDLSTNLVTHASHSGYFTLH